MNADLEKENAFVGAYWWARQETREECANRIASFLVSMADESLFSRWCLPGRSRKTANVPLEMSCSAIAAKLEQNHTDIPRRPIPELGYSLSIWNGNDESTVGLSITCGAYSKVVGNAVVLSLPRQSPPQTESSIAWFRGLVRKAASAFDPDVAVATSSELNSRGGRTVRENPAWVRYERGRGIIE